MDGSATEVSATETVVSQATLAATTFTRFPELPAELQLEIWKYAAIIPRTEQITATLKIKQRTYLPPTDPAYHLYVLTVHFRSLYRLLGACFDSREAALKENPNFPQVYNYKDCYELQKLYFKAERNIIHFELGPTLSKHPEPSRFLPFIHGLENVRAVSIRAETKSRQFIQAATRKLKALERFLCVYGSYIPTTGVDKWERIEEAHSHEEYVAVESHPVDRDRSPTDLANFNPFMTRMRYDPRGCDLEYWTKDYKRT
ncbi:hypothetical protein G7Y89_g8205 [Cudoniella acicularis]|uniref:2EXR domain-containing protein n=1 Tax=Cudoniella acicularis TaxID=354080 RepID=A0A8H4RIK8_9HELO|nr:hypothetical protein G7Y89_g8205 [Cudoniella acicularis]